jgi:hypothetical protein
MVLQQAAVYTAMNFTLHKNLDIYTGIEQSQNTAVE